MNEQVKLAKSEEQPIRKYRRAFTSTKGLFRKKRWVMLDIALLVTKYISL